MLAQTEGRRSSVCSLRKVTRTQGSVLSEGLAPAAQRRLERVVPGRASDFLPSKKQVETRFLLRE